VKLGRFCEWWLWMWNKAFSIWLEIRSSYFPWGTEENCVKTDHTQLPLIMDCLNLKMKALRSFEMSEATHPTTQCHIPKELNLHSQYFGGDSNLETLKCNQKPPFFSVMDEELGVMGRKLFVICYLCCIRHVIVDGGSPNDFTAYGFRWREP